MNIALIGFRGTGKTTIGKRLARRLQMKFIDLDHEIVRRAGKAIPQIFAESGEQGFREMERRAVEAAAGMDNACIACGGGVVLRKASIDSLKRNSTIILLEARPEVIHARIRHDRNRPSLTGKGAMEEILHLLEERRPLYDAAAQMRFDTSDDSVAETVQKIISGLNERKLI